MGFGIDISIFRRNFRNGGNKPKTWTAIPLDMLPEHRDCTFTMLRKTSARRSLRFVCMASHAEREKNCRRRRQSGADPFLTARFLQNIPGGSTYITQWKSYVIHMARARTHIWRIGMNSTRMGTRKPYMDAQYLAAFNLTFLSLLENKQVALNEKSQ